MCGYMHTYDQCTDCYTAATRSGEALERVLFTFPVPTYVARDCQN